MAKAFTGFLAEDGSAHATEVAAVTHDVKAELAKSFPEMRTITGSADKFNAMMLAVMPLAKLVMGGLASEEQTTLVPGTTRYEPPETSRFNPSLQGRWTGPCAQPEPEGESIL